MVSARRSQSNRAASSASSSASELPSSAEPLQVESTRNSSMSSSRDETKEFATPGRAGSEETGATTVDLKRPNQETTAAEAVTPSVTMQVTPPDTVGQKSVDSSSGDTSDSDKRVHFGGPLASATTSSVVDANNVKIVAAAAAAAAAPSDDSPTQRGLVSRRGRYVSPGRRSEASAITASSPAAAASSPAAAAESSSPKDEQDEAVLEYKTFRSPTRKREDEVPSLCSTGSGVEKANHPATTEKRLPTASISCDLLAFTTASPLASNDSTDDAAAAKSKSSSSSEDARIMSPPPAKKMDRKKTPPRGTVGKMPTLDDPKSPGGFLSPSPPTPSQRSSIDAAMSFEEKKRENEEEEVKHSPRRDRDRCTATPTDFTNDYGKGHQMSSSFDTSHVLAWLQSPTGNGLFSPGGFGSLVNTPGGAPRTPRTPTISTSFFFSDVASLPRGDNLTPKVGDSASKRKGISNIICISPLASSKARNGAASTTTTPLNLKDVFSSPVEKSRVRGMPDFRDTPTTDSSRGPQRTGSKDPSLDAVHLAEREIMEDEDLSVLLQLAANTPKSAGPAGGGPVFRSPAAAKDGEGGENGEKLGGLQIPMITGRDKTSKLARKSQSRDNADADDFAPPQLGMRSSSSNGSKEIYVGGNSSKDGKSEKAEGDGKKARKPSGTPYAIHHPYENMSYYGMPGGMPPSGMSGPSGSMRVVVGGPPPRPSSSGSPSRPSMSASPHPPPHYHDYPPPSGMPYPPPPPGMYPQYPPGPMGYPYQPYPPPPPRHLPLYAGAQNGPKSSSSSAIKKAKPTKVKSGGGTVSGNKRGSPLLESSKTPSNKKVKKASTGSPGSNHKKKVKSPPVADKAKAASAVHKVNEASGGKNDKAAALAAAILRGVTMRPSGKWQAQLYFAGKSRYIGVFDTREKAALAYEIAREKLKSGPTDGSGKSTENLVNAARKAAFEGVNEQSMGKAAAATTAAAADA